MKAFLLFLVLLTAVSQRSQAQCSIDSSQTAPGIYPNPLPFPHVGEYFNEDITIVFPTETLGLNILSIQLDSIIGDIPGMTWACNSPLPNCTYYPQQSIYGCINVSGIPQQAGYYIITIQVLAEVQLVGTQNLSITIRNIVKPGILNKNGFTATPDNGCAPLTTVIQNNDTGHYAYSWDFGNGVTSTLEQPGTLLYDSAGSYIIHRNTVPQPGVQYYLTGVTVNSVPDAYSDGLAFDVADLYIKLKDTSGVNYVNANIINNQVSNVFIAVDTLLMNNEIYTVEVWDDDPLFGAPDDSLGVISFSGWGQTGNATSTLSGASGILDVTYHLITLPIEPVTDTLVINVYSPVAQIIYSNDTLYSSVPNTAYQWYLNNQLLSGNTLSFITNLNAGSYSLVVTDSNGCSNTSSPFIITNIANNVFTDISMFPNPAQNSILIKGLKESCNVLITDLTGQIVLSEYLKQNSIQISHLPEGIYILNLYLENGIYRKEIMIIR